jgi:hypothetical protein
MAASKAVYCSGSFELDFALIELPAELGYTIVNCSVTTVATSEREKDTQKKSFKDSSLFPE